MRRICLIAFFLQLCCLSVVGQISSWIDGTAHWGLFPREKCKTISKVTISRVRGNRSNEIKRSDTEGIYEFDTFGKLIRSIEFNEFRDYKDSIGIKYSYGADQLLDSLCYFGPMHLRSGSNIEYFGHDGRLDSIVDSSDCFMTRTNQYFWNSNEQLVMMVTATKSPGTCTPPDGGAPSVKHDSVIYEYDPHSRMKNITEALYGSTVRFNIRYVTKDNSLVIVQSAENYFDIIIQLNAHNLPEKTYWVDLRNRHWWLHSVFSYEYR